MTDSLTIDGRTYKFDAAAPIDISIPLQFNGPQPNAYGVETATSVPCASGDLVGDTRKGGSCNFEQYTLIPHCNGTHTECVGHITHDRISVRECLGDALVPAILLSIEPQHPAAGDSYSIAMSPTDRVVTRPVVEQAFRRFRYLFETNGAFRALIFRTTPNPETKLTARYTDDIPPYFTTEAMEYIVGLGIDHLVVDLPSIDRLYDEGKLSNHRIFWKVDRGSFELSEIARRQSTITEFAFIPNEVRDGAYILNLQIAPFAADASPSRPILFRVIEN